jgi:peptidoglycan/xylan/chitin deacetylase (PgdA/CDA1 family)
MYVEPDTLATHLRFLQQHFEIIPISALSYDPERNFSGSNGKSLCALTFDDGWYDFYEYVYPILKHYQIPATVFLPTNFIGTSKWFWTDRLTHLFVQKESQGNSEVSGPSSKNSLENLLQNLKGPKEIRLEKAIEELKVFREERIESVLSELSIRWKINPVPPSRSFLNWGEVREMAQSGLVSFGSHTRSHRILTTLEDKEILDELIRSKDRLIAEKAVDPSFIPFSYPNGNYNEKILKMVKEAGYNLAVTAENGWNDSNSNLFKLKRIGIHQDMAFSKSMFGCRISKIF